LYFYRNETNSNTIILNNCALTNGDQTSNQLS